jgi:hypothetical protein
MMKETDLLYGIVSGVGDSHYLLADFDEIGLDDLMTKVGGVLFDKYGFGNCYILSSGRGLHLVSFSKKLTLREYVEILKELGACGAFIGWIERVGYGVLRISRRSSHRLVPRLVAVLSSDANREEDELACAMYFKLLNLENDYVDVKRVVVFEAQEIRQQKGFYKVTDHQRHPETSTPSPLLSDLNAKGEKK